MDEKTSLRSVKMLTYLISTNGTLSRPSKHRSNDSFRVLRQRIYQSRRRRGVVQAVWHDIADVAQQWKQRQRRNATATVDADVDGGSVRWVNARINDRWGANSTADRPKKTFQSVKWVSLFNSLAAEKNVEIVNNISSVLSNLSLVGRPGSFASTIC